MQCDAVNSVWMIRPNGVIRHGGFLASIVVLDSDVAASASDGPPAFHETIVAGCVGGQVWSW